MAYLGVIVVLPLAAVVLQVRTGGWHAFTQTITARDTLTALELTFAASAVVTAVNATMGTIIAWVLVRDRFPGSWALEGLIDLPFALPTVVAGLTLLALYGPRSPLGVSVAYARAGVLLALLFVTLPFVVRTVQPVLAELDREAEEAAASLGAGPLRVFMRVVLPALRPAIISGMALSFARALGEFGSVVLISGNIPNHTEVASVRVSALIGTGDLAGAASVSVVLLAASLAMLVVFELLRRRGADA